MSHQYFEVMPTAATIRERGAIAIYAGDAPRKNNDGTTAHSMRAPLLLMPPGMFKDSDEIMAKIARILNEHAAEFFDSAQNAALAPDKEDDE